MAFNEIIEQSKSLLDLNADIRDILFDLVVNQKSPLYNVEALEYEKYKDLISKRNIQEDILLASLKKKAFFKENIEHYKINSSKVMYWSQTCGRHLDDDGIPLSESLGIIMPGWIGTISEWNAELANKVKRMFGDHGIWFVNEYALMMLLNANPDLNRGHHENQYCGKMGGYDIFYNNKADDIVVVHGKGSATVKIKDKV